MGCREAQGLRPGAMTGRLTAVTVPNITEPGRHADGLGLSLNVTVSGTKSWLQRVSVGGRRRELGLGPYPTVGLADARRAGERICNHR